VIQQPSSGKNRKMRPPVQGTIELCRSAEGVMYFSTRVGNEVRRWLVYPSGEKWLADHGYREGKKITGGTAGYMRELDLVYTLKPSFSKRRQKPNPLAKLARDTELWEKRRTEEKAHYPELSKRK
jgi:hypothetical protein